MKNVKQTQMIKRIKRGRQHRYKRYFDLTIAHTRDCKMTPELVKDLIRELEPEGRGWSRNRRVRADLHTEETLDDLRRG